MRRDRCFACGNKCYQFNAANIVKEITKLNPKQDAHSRVFAIREL